MQKTLMKVLVACLILPVFAPLVQAEGFVPVPFKLGNEILMENQRDLILGKRIGLVTNQSGVNQEGVSTIDVLADDPDLNLVALYAPEHGLDGTIWAGHEVPFYEHPTLGIPVYSLYGATRFPTEDMLKDVDILLYDIQDIGSRTYTYISTLNYVMQKAAEYGKEVLVLDRPNPVGCHIVEAPVLEDPFKTFVGVDTLPMAHGMTAGELAQFFNRNIGADLTVIPMEGYTRDMIYQDTGLSWVATSPNIPDIESVFGYMATGLGEGTGIRQQDKFKWIGGPGIDSYVFADLLNGADIPGVRYVPDPRGSLGGVLLDITDYRVFNPAKSGFYALAYAKRLNNFTVPKGDVMFTKIMGTDKVAGWLDQKMLPQDMEKAWAENLAEFKKIREDYLIYGNSGHQGNVGVFIDGVSVFFDSLPYIDENQRTIVPVRAITERLGAKVSWDEKESLVTIEKGDTVVKLTIGKDVIEVNGEAVVIDTVPVIKDSRTMVPARFVAEFLGADVSWDESGRIVIIGK